MKHLNKAWKNIKRFFIYLSKNIFKSFQSRSLSTQLIITIILIFISFFILQSILTSQFFNTYYTSNEFDAMQADLSNYVDEMNTDDVNRFDATQKYYQKQLAYTVIVDVDYRIIDSNPVDYTYTVYDDTIDESFIVNVHDYSFEYIENSEIEVTLIKQNETYEMLNYKDNRGNNIIYLDIDCEEMTCYQVDGKITTVSKPNNLNYLVKDLPIVIEEVSKIQNNLVTFETNTDGQGSWYRSSDGATDKLVFIHSLGNWQSIVTIIPITNTSDITSIVSQYTYYVYLTAIVIIILWSFRLSNLISKPIKNIELVTKEIASLNFNVKANEFNNKETSSLSESINLIAINLRNTLETLNTKNSELKYLYDEQTKQVTLKKQLVSSISHELKTPLMVMQVIIQGILDEIISSEDQVVELENVLEEIQKSSNMIQDMLQIYRLDDANTKLDITQFDLSHTVCFFMKDFENVFKSNNLNVVSNIEDGIMIEADHKLIKRVISNFVTNAIKYTPKNKDIYITLVEKDDHVYFELINKGVTIKEHDLDNIWMPFYRVEHTEKRNLNAKGSGIGLYLVSEILKAHNAEFGISNVKNGVKAFFKLKNGS